jgi:DNA polymerase IV
MSVASSTGRGKLVFVAATILHVDMDAFYAAVEAHDDPALAGRPLIVGGKGRRGVVASCSYEARAFGVRSAMPSSQARQLCPHAVFVSGRFDRYHEVSQQIHGIFAAVTPRMEPIALDEAFLDVTGATRLFGPAPVIAAELRRRIRDDVGLAASVGVAPTKFLAKLASEAAKPRPALKGVIPGRGVVVVEPGEELAFLHPHRIEALWGVGPATAERIHRLGVTTVGDLAALPVDTLERVLGRVHGRHLHDLAWARDDRQVEVDREVKSVSHEETYATDRFRHDELQPEVVRMADSVAARLRRAGLAGRTVSIKMRFGDFTTISRARSAKTPLDTGPEIAAIAGELLGAVDVSPGVRLLGVGASMLRERAERAAEQLALDLDGSRASRWDQASGAVDAVRERFGDRAVAPASLAGEQGLRVKRVGDTQWGPGAPEPPG